MYPRTLETHHPFKTHMEHVSAAALHLRVSPRGETPTPIYDVTVYPFSHMWLPQLVGHRKVETTNGCLHVI